MRTTHQPYRSLVNLHKQIDRDTAMDDESVIVGLEKTQARHGDIQWERVIRRPRILYSLMVGS